MIVEILETSSTNQKWRKKKIHVLRCDLINCANTWEAPFRGNRENDKLDFCCPGHKYESRNFGGLLSEKISRRVFSRYGVVSTNQLLSTKNKALQTKLLRWGDANYNNRIAATKTCIEKYGYENPFQSPEVQSKSKSTMIKKYGVDDPNKSEIIKAHIQSTLERRYGVSHAWNIPEHREHNKSKDIRNKIHQTMKIRGNYGKSKIEDRLYSDLCDLFGQESVERQANLNNWSIDFKVLNTYIQLDGTYWHGSNRTVQDLQASNNPRDVVILKTKLRDNEQNEWCRDNRIPFIRVTDTDYNKFGISVIQEKLNS